jgi:hypothetical protein
MDAIGPASHLPRVHCSTEPSRHQATSGQGAWSGVHRAGIRLFELGLVVPSSTAPATARSPVCSCLSRGRERLLGSSSAPPCRAQLFLPTSVLAPPESGTERARQGRRHAGRREPRTGAGRRDCCFLEVFHSFTLLSCSLLY